jgi:hypothetical protein
LFATCKVNGTPSGGSTTWCLLICRNGTGWVNP